MDMRFHNLTLNIALFENCLSPQQDWNDLYEGRNLISFTAAFFPGPEQASSEAPYGKNTCT